jgi:methylenetetrahydrofolate dehydrogenase (NADP+) / methenyltetrahydrofolate cyclohydrolase
MTATIMDGSALARELEAAMKEEVKALKNSGVSPKLATVLVGDDQASKVYVRSKHKAAERVGIATLNNTLPGDISEGELEKALSELNRDPEVNGILLQLPLPGHISPRRMTDMIDPRKDVDGLTTANAGRLVYGESDLIPCTPRGVMELLRRYEVRLRGAHAVIINRSSLVGKPLYHLLLEEDATVTVCHSRSEGLAGITSRADILVTAVGRRPAFVVTADMVKEGAVVVDVAMNRVEGKLLGDVDFVPVSEKASLITPVPGGVGPMTVTMLLRNTIIAARRQNGLIVEVAG